jgi:hypothetical protein
MMGVMSEQESGRRSLVTRFTSAPVAALTLSVAWGCGSSDSAGTGTPAGPKGADASTQAGGAGALGGAGRANTGGTGGAGTGGAGTGGTSTGGTSTGGTSTGGTSTGGTSTGGTSTGGAGGANAGGTNAGGAGTGGTSTGGASNTGGSGGVSAVGLAGRYLRDVGIDKDPDVVWTENFEEGSVAALVLRYEDSKQPGLGFDTDVPGGSSGAASGKLTANGAGPNAVDFYKKLPGYDELYIRYYAKYEAGVAWHHTGVWVGGYNPPTSYPNPQAGLKPNGDDRFSVSLEPMEQGAEPRMDFYDYWMKMHSWMDVPTGTTAYYGNSFVHDPGLTAKARWQCIELHIKLNPAPASGAGAELGVWVDDRSVAQFTDAAPLGYWVKDKFCPSAATGVECTQYRPASPALVPLDLQYRSTASLKINVFWPQNYITSGGAGSVWYDDMVLAKSRVGCLRP